MKTFNLFLLVLLVTISFCYAKKFNKFKGNKDREFEGIRKEFESQESLADIYEREHADDEDDQEDCSDCKRGRVDDKRNKTSSTQTQNEFPMSCYDLQQLGDEESGIRTIYPWRSYPNLGQIVYCDQKTDGGGWTLIQKRGNSSWADWAEDFQKTWIEYQFGFGNIAEDFWLGNEIIHEMTSTSLQELRIEFYQIKSKETKWGKWKYFHVADADEKFQIKVGRFYGNSTNILKDANRKYFSTRDEVNGRNAQGCTKL